MKRVLTIAGSDCSGGAGIQADLKTITAFGMYGMSVITALTAQNTRGVFDVRETDERMLRGQFEAVCSDLPPDAVKIGMLPSETAVLAVADALEKWKPRHVVCDPVMVSTSGRTLMSPQAEAAARELLYPRVSLITPNMSEAKRLLAREFPDMDGNIPPGFKSSPEEECRRSRAELGSKAGPENEEEPENKAIQEDAARILGDRLKTSVLVKGGHVTGGADDCLYYNGRLVWFRSERLPAKNSHGTGCTLSSAIACGLAGGWPLEDAVAFAKGFLFEALRTEPGFGHGNGPLNHCFAIREVFHPKKKAGSPLHESVSIAYIWRRIIWKERTGR